MLWGMADDFVGVPADKWADYQDVIRGVRVLTVALAVAVYLLVMTLIRKGVLTGWSDLLDTPSV